MYKDFADMENLTEVEYQGEYTSLSKVDLTAFQGCDSLISLAFPDSVKYITGALYDDTNIRSILVENKKCQFSDMLIEGVTIYGYSGSTAEKYAEKYENVYFVTEDQWTGKRPPKNYPEDNGEIPEAQASGTCNGIKLISDYDVPTTISWTVDSHTLIIDGEGQYYGWWDDPPWMEYKDCITKVIIGSDINGIIGKEFVGMKNLSAVEYKEGFSSIKMMSLNAFKGCPKLNKLVVPKSAEYLSGEINRMTDDFEITEIYVMNPQCNIELDLNNYWDNDLIFYSDTSIYGSVYYFTERHSRSTELRDGSLWTGYRPPNTKGEVEAEEVYYYTDEDDGSLHSELIGSRVYWQVKDSVFTISGSGIPYEEIDISECRDFIKTVKIGNEIQDLSNSIFADCVNLRNVEIDGEKSELLYFSTSWFKGCTDIEPFTLPATLKEIRVDCADTGVTEFTVLSRDCGIWASKYAKPLTIRCYSDSKIYKSAQNYDNITVYALDRPADEISLGDVNGDGMVDATDASAILVAYAIVSTGGASPFSDEQTAAADVNADGMVDATDASTVLVFYSYVSTGGTITDMREWLNGT